jgi:GDPmannose 4,6-dehydratase
MDYVEAIWLMLQQEEPDDFVIATGKAHSVREFTELAFKKAGFKITWKGSGVNEIGQDKETGRTLVKVDPRYFRPAEVASLLGDATKVKEKLGWVPKITFNELVETMVQEDLKEAQKENLIRIGGYKTYNNFD